MGYRIGILLGLVAAYAQTGHAFPGGTLGKEIITNASRNAFRTLPKNGCVDFSGSWKGQCKADDKTEDVSFTVQQKGCETLTVGDDTTFFSSLKTHSDAFPTKDGSASYQISITADWNPEGTQVNTYFTGLVKSIGKAGYLPLAGNSTTKMDGGKMVSDAEILGHKINCVYEKQ